MGSDHVDENIQTALEALGQQYENTANLIAGIADEEAGLKAATELTELLRQATISAGQIRAKRAYGIWESRNLSLSKLADIANVSKTRAAEIVNTFKKSQEESTP